MDEGLSSWKNSRGLWVDYINNGELGWTVNQWNVSDEKPIFTDFTGFIGFAG